MLGKECLSNARLTSLTVPNACSSMCARMFTFNSARCVVRFFRLVGDCGSCCSGSSTLNASNKSWLRPVGLGCGSVTLSKEAGKRREIKQLFNILFLKGARACPFSSSSSLFPRTIAVELGVLHALLLYPLHCLAKETFWSVSSSPKHSPMEAQ